MQKPTVLLLGVNDAQEADLRKALKEIATLNRLNVPAELVPDEMRRLRASTAIVAITAETPQRFGLIHNITASGGVVIVISPTKDPELILRAMRAGAREFVLESDAEELRVAVRSQAKSSEHADGLGTVITCFGAKGGVGATTVATNLGGSMARAGMRVCLLDLNLHLGDVLSFMDVTGGFSISDVVTNMNRLDRDLVDSSMAKHSSGLHLLAQSGKMEEADQIKATDVVGLIQFLRKHYDNVIVDGVRAFDEISLAALDGSQFLLMLMTQDVPAVRNGQRCLDLFTRLGYDESKIKLVLNRFQKSSKITLEVVADTLKLPVAHSISNDFVSVIDAINRGMLLADVAPRARLTKDIEELVPLLAGQRKERVRRPSLFGNIFGGGKKVADGAA
ncbi:MAG TPA: AAA family ATPase [Polyangia bacterium]|nr:AAA family ATPase [Polyangia bacterium]